MINEILVYSIFLIFFQQVSCLGQIRPANIFSDNMVLQREIEIPIWGKATAGEKITINLDFVNVSTIASTNGNWELRLPAFDAGGPYDLIIKGKKDSIVFKNILVGDVWFASGQSNMEHPMKGWEWIPHSAVDNFEEEIKDSEYPEIRLFTVPKFPALVKQDDLIEGKWEIAGPEYVSGFSSTAWFFAKELYQKLKVPIGIIHSSWGGTPISTWISGESVDQFKSSVNFPAITDKFEKNEWAEKVAESIETHRMRRNQISYPKTGLSEEIVIAGYDDSDWQQVDLLDENNCFGNILWLRKKIFLPQKLHGEPLKLSMGFFNRQSHVFFNGTKIGYFLYPKPVLIEIPTELIRIGENILTIRVAQPWGESQIIGDKDQFFISNPEGSFYMSISNKWRANDQLEPIVQAVKSYQNSPSFLFNGMVAPVVPYGLKGFIWYQGESDTGRPFLYEQMFQQLILEWRKLWKQGDLPFLFVQVSNIHLSHEFEKDNASWSLLREAQEKALSLPHTGMVVSIDIGDPYDIHPKNKQDFGHRLALQAFNVAYGQPILADGPLYQSHQIKRDTVIIKLQVKSHPLSHIDHKDECGYEIAGKNGAFHLAKVFLKNNEVHLTSPKVKDPIAVRYAWGNNPKSCIFNKAGLPLAPFRLKNLQ
jgi:sialate O-acetylesterase